MKLLNRNNLAVRFAAAKDESRYTLKAILATENETVATDGHMMCRVSLPSLDASHFPSFEGFKPNGFTRGLIPVDAAKDIEGAIPKKSHIPILMTAAISSEAIDDRTVLKVATTDLDTPKVFTVRQPSGQFPNWDLDALWNGKVTTDICFDARLLLSIAQAATKFSDRRMPVIRLRFRGDNSAVRFDLVNDDGQEMNGLLMPVRGEVSPKFKEPAPVEESAEPVEAEPVEAEPVEMAA